jgi:xylulokinase
MGTPLILSADLGTTFIKVGLYDEACACLAAESEKVKADISQPGSFAQDPDFFVHGTLRLIKRVIEQVRADPAEVAVVSFTGQMAGTMGIDASWNAVTPWTGTLDIRHMPYGKLMLEACREEILRLSGTNAPFTAAKMKWVEKEHPEAYRKARKFLNLSGWVAGKISNLPVEQAFMDMTYLTWTGIGDLARGDWSKSLCRTCGIDMDRLPRVVKAGSLVGGMNTWAAAECGLAQGTPVVSAAGDKSAGCLAAGAVTPGMLVDESSTVAALSICVPGYIPDVKHKTLDVIPAAIPGQFLGCFYMTGSGRTIEWFVDNFAASEKAHAEKSGVSVYDVLDQEAAAVPPGSEGLLCIGMLAGRALPSNPNIRGLWVGHSWGHTPAHFYRSLLESYAYEYGHCLNVIRETYRGLDLAEVMAVGGAANSTLWNGIKSDVTGLPVTTLNRSDFTLLGTSIVGGHAVGMFKDAAQTARTLIVKASETAPDPRRHAYYAKLVRLYESLTAPTAKIYEDLAALPKFRGHGTPWHSGGQECPPDGENA